MSRDDGFPIADINTSLISDPKVSALARRQRDGNKTAATVALYMATVLESWRSGERATFSESLPPWFLDEAQDLLADLQAVGLLDDQGRIPSDSWDKWFGPAWERRERRRSSGAIGGRRSSEKRSDAEATLEQRSSDAQAALNPSVLPSVRQTVKPPARPPGARAGDGNRNEGLMPIGSILGSFGGRS